MNTPSPQLLGEAKAVVMSIPHPLFLWKRKGMVVMITHTPRQGSSPGLDCEKAVVVVEKAIALKLSLFCETVKAMVVMAISFPPSFGKGGGWRP